MSGMRALDVGWRRGLLRLCHVERRGATVVSLELPPCSPGTGSPGESPQAILDKIKGA